MSSALPAASDATLVEYGTASIQYIKREKNEAGVRMVKKIALEEHFLAPGLAPQEVESQITVPIEQGISCAGSRS